MRKLVLLLFVCTAAIVVAWLVSRRPASVAKPSTASVVSARTPLGEPDDELESVPRAVVAGAAVSRTVAAPESDSVVAGVVVDENDQPLPGATVTLTGFTATKDPSGNTKPWVTSNLGTEITDAEGRFELRFETTENRLSLRASHPDAAAPARSVAAFGQRDAKLVLKRSGALEMRIIVPGDVVMRGLSIGLQSATSLDDHDLLSFRTIGSDELEHGFTKRLAADVERLSPRVISATFPDLEPVNWTVTVLLEPRYEQIELVRDVLVESRRTTRDSRLLPLDLRTVLAAVHLTITDSMGKPVPGGFVRWPRTNDLEDAPGFVFTDGQSRFYAKPDTQLEIVAQGFMKQIVPATDGARTVVLQPGRKVRLVLDGAGVPPPPRMLRLALLRRAARPDPSPYLVVDTRGESAETIASLAMRSELHWYDAAEFDGSGSAVATVEGPGEYFACWYLARPDELSERLRLVQIIEPEPLRVVVADQDSTPMRVHLHPTSLAEAMERN
jgi:hypothetical protein